MLDHKVQTCLNHKSLFVPCAVFVFALITVQNVVNQACPQES